MKNSTTLIAFITALALHLIMGGVLLMGVDFNLFKDKPKQEVVIIKASTVSQKLFDDLAKKKAQIKEDKLAAEKKKADQIRAEKARIKREKERAEKRRKAAEVKRIKAEKAEIARKKKEEARIIAEKKAAAEALKAKKAAAKAKKIAEEKRKKQEAEAKRVEAEKLAAAKALKEKKAREAKIKAAEEAERLRLAELDKQMEAEFADASSSAQNSKQLSEIARYKALIQDKISRNWQVEPSMNGETCTLAIRLAPDGLVLSVSRTRGDQKLCASAERATLKSKTLPIPKDPEIAPQFRDFDITLELDL